MTYVSSEEKKFSAMLAIGDTEGAMEEWKKINEELVQFRGHVRTGTEAREKLKTLLLSEKLTMWDAKDLLGLTVGLARTLTSEIYGVLSGPEEDVDIIIQRTKTLAGHMSLALDKVMQASESHYDEMAAWYDEYSGKHRGLVKRIEDLKVPVINIPYNFKELLDLVERCSNYDDEQWQRVIDLGKALGKRDQA